MSLAGPSAAVLPEHDREERHELPRCVVAIGLVLGDSQPQEEVSTFLEAVGIEGDFLQSPDQVAAHVAPHFGQIPEVPKTTPNPLDYEANIDFRQGREDLRVMRTARGLRRRRMAPRRGKRERRSGERRQSY